jgi:uncharacterized protein (DUF1330 family)
MASYFVALIDIHDPQGYERYLDGFDEVFERFDGEVVAVEDEPSVLEGAWPARRTVLIRFPNDEDLLRWYESPEYQRLAAIRRVAADARIAVIHGRD